MRSKKLTTGFMSILSLYWCIHCISLNVTNHFLVTISTQKYTKQIEEHTKTLIKCQCFCICHECFRFLNLDFKIRVTKTCKRQYWFRFFTHLYRKNTNTLWRWKKKKQSIKGNQFGKASYKQKKILKREMLVLLWLFCLFVSYFYNFMFVTWMCISVDGVSLLTNSLLFMPHRTTVKSVSYQGVVVGNEITH